MPNPRGRSMTSFTPFTGTAMRDMRWSPTKRNVHL
jgi:hypothetical protein